MSAAARRPAPEKRAETPRTAPAPLRHIARLRRMIRGGDAARFAPRSGLLAWLAGAAAGAMSFLGALAAALAILAGALAGQWEGELARSATLVLPAETSEAQMAAVETALGQTHGVAAFRRIGDAEMRSLLAPWLGEDAPIETLGAPVMLAVEIEGDGPDGAALSRRLALEAPGALWDDHGRWRAPLLSAARILRALALIAAGLALLGVAAAVSLGARATLSAARPVIVTLRLMGATDRFIAGAFTRGAAIRAGIGGAVGAAAAALAIWALDLAAADPEGPGAAVAGTSALLSAPAGTGTAALLVCAAFPLLCAAVAWGAARAAAAAALRRID